MTIENICDVRDGIEKLVDAHPEELRELFDMNEASCDSSDVLKKEYEDLVAPGRQLHIGIVGRVKAGKSSMLNSLFFGGKDILPKAATPMTAALTKLKYSEKPTVKINFFEQSDIAKIKENANKYNATFKRRVEDILKTKRENAEKKKEPFNEEEQRIRCEKLARNELSSNVILAGAVEQQAMLDKAGSYIMQYVGQSIEKDITNVENLGAELKEYVGADGKFTAITRDVELGFNFDELKDITVVDTPGFDDPVPSRDAAARQSLKKCDVIFILSPAGQFCNEEDKINIEKIENGEGVQDIFVVASKIDAELGNEAKDEAYGDIVDEMRIITANISQTLGKLIEGMKNGKVRDKLSEDLDNGLLYTSGACQSMYETWEDRDSWNADLMDVWERLNETYPELFGSEDESAREILKQIGNVEKIRTKISEVRGKKDDILHSREEKFLNAKCGSIKDLVTNLKNDFAGKKASFESLNIGKLKEEQKKQSDNFVNLQSAFEDMLTDTFENYFIETRELCNQIIKDYYEGSVSDANEAKGSGSETKTGVKRVAYDVEVEDEGICAWLCRMFGAGGYITETRHKNVEYSYDESYNYVDASEVRDALSGFALDLKDELSIQIDKKRRLLRGMLKSNILRIWAEFEMNEFCGDQMRGAQASQIVSKIPDCSIDIEWELPSNLQCSGRLRNSDADKYMDKAKSELRRVKISYTNSIKDFLSNLKDSLNSKETADMILQKMKKELETLTKQMEVREATLDTYRHIETELSDFVSKVDL